MKKKSKKQVKEEIIKKWEDSGLLEGLLSKESPAFPLFESMKVQIRIPFSTLPDVKPMNKIKKQKPKICYLDNQNK